MQVSGAGTRISTTLNRIRTVFGVDRLFTRTVLLHLRYEIIFDASSVDFFFLLMQEFRGKTWQMLFVPTPPVTLQMLSRNFMFCHV